MDGFRRLRVSFASPGGHSSTHTVYCKVHSVRVSSDVTPNGKTLFTLGWPSYCTTDTLTELFSRAGHVTDVYLQSSPGPVQKEHLAHSVPGFQVGYVVMSSSSEANATLDLGDSEVPIPCRTGEVGLRRWAGCYQAGRPRETLLEGRVEGTIAEYDEREGAGQDHKRGAGQPDEDGWITVTRKRKRTQVTGEEDTKKRKKSRQLVNFYPWQQREGQREALADMRRRFEEDKKRVLEMKARRKFKPF